MSDSKELWERIQEIEEQVEKDPKMIKLKEKLERELGSLSQEDLDRVMRSSKPKVNKRWNLLYQIEYKGKNKMVKDRNVFCEVIKILAEPIFDNMTIEKVQSSDQSPSPEATPWELKCETRNMLRNPYGD